MMLRLNNRISKETTSAATEKILQFGTGVLLRGLPDYFIDQANRQGIFNGRILVVKSTASGPSDAFNEQDGLYTLLVRGLENGKTVDEQYLNSSISRVLSAASNWAEIVEAGTAPAVAIIISNTTEAGIVLQADDRIDAEPPQSFPGKLTALLAARFGRGGGTQAKGYVILPTELISDNGDKLRDMVLELAAINRLGDDFINWIKQANYFCNTLVDRIVPGALAPAEKEQAETHLGYRDELMIMAEPYRLWAIETSEQTVIDLLSFAKADPGVVLTPDIHKFKELKLRLLNGTHSISCALAMLAGFRNVKTAMQHPDFRQFVTDVMLKEIVPSILGAGISREEAETFAHSVIDRFGNPFLDHLWVSISMNYTSKIHMRNVPLIKAYADRFAAVPYLHALGFAAYLQVLKEVPDIKDEHAAYIRQLWQQLPADEVVDTVLANTALWSENLAGIPGFASTVKGCMAALADRGVLPLLTKQSKQYNK